MNGRFRSAWMRWARRMGRRERVKFADENNASVDRGGRPCLRGCQSSAISCRHRVILHQISQAKSVQWLICEVCDVVVGDCC